MRLSWARSYSSIGKHCKAIEFYVVDTWPVRWTGRRVLTSCSRVRVSLPQISWEIMPPGVRVFGILQPRGSAFRVVSATR